MNERDPNQNLQILGRSLHAAGLAVALLILGLGYAFVLRPLEADRAASAARKEDLGHSLADAANVRGEHRRLSAAAAEMERKVAELSGRVPQGPSEAEFLSELSVAAAQAGLKVRDYRPGVIRAQGTCSQLEIQLSCIGSYPGLCGFLERLAALPRLSRVVQLDVAAAPDPGQYPASLSLVVFFNLNVEPEAAAPPATKKRGKA